MAHLSVAADLIGRTRSDGTPVDQHGDAVGECEDGIHVVLDQQHAAVLLQPTQQLDQALRFLDAHAGHRLVEPQELRRARERHCDLELALFAVTQRRGKGAGARTEADGLEVSTGKVAQAMVAADVSQETEGVAVMGLDRECGIVEHGELAQH